MKNKKIFLFMLAMGVAVGLISPGSSSFGVIDQIKTSAFKGFEIFTDTNGTETNSTIEERFYGEIEDFYDSIERLFVLYSDTNSTSQDINATAYTLGDHEFYFGETEDGYYFGDVNGTIYYIQDINGTLPDSADAHLNSLLPTFDKIMKALEDGKLGRVFGLLNSCEVRMKTTERYLSKVEVRNARREEREAELKLKREEREKQKDKGKDKDNKGKDKGKGNDNKGKGKKKDKDNDKGKGKKNNGK